MTDSVIEQIKALAGNDSAIDVCWLYGSRARGQAEEKSDYDLAVLFQQAVSDPIDRRLRPEMLAIQWSQQLNQKISIVDINLAPLPLAHTVMRDNTTLFCRNAFKSLDLERRIMSKWEIDHLYHRKHYA